MEIKRYFILWSALIVHLTESQSDDLCPGHFNCVPFSECKNMDRNTVVYPCEVDGVDMVCCPENGKITTEVVSRTPKFPERCGENPLSDRITGGEKASIGQFPFMALLGYIQKRVPFPQFLCGGSIITTKYVLTAAHCTNLDTNLKLSTVRVGELNISSPIDCEQTGSEEKVCADPHIDIPVEKVIPHESFNTDTLKNDIALVRLTNSISFTDYVKPICLPFTKQLQAKNLEGSTFTISGWGKTSSVNFGGASALLYAKVKTWNIFRCNNAVPAEVRPIQNTQLCASGPKDQDACKGDSGGPLFNLTIDGSKKEFKMLQIGIVSFGAARACGNRELPTVYTRVDGYLHWIIDNVK